MHPSVLNEKEFKKGTAKTLSGYYCLKIAIAFSFLSSQVFPEALK